MDNKAQGFSKLSDCSKLRYGIHGNAVTVNVVRNVVFNMESVLADLKGIMGEISTIVDHIDAVTGRNGKHGKTGTEYKDLHSVKKDYGQYLCGNYSESKLVKIGTAVPIEAYEAVVELSHIHNLLPSHKVLKVKGVSQHQDFLTPQQQQRHTAVNIDGAGRIEWKNSSKMLGLSKEFNQMSKNGTKIMSHNGAIAIVYPTIINSLPAISRNESINTLGFQNESIGPFGTQKSINNNSTLVMPAKRGIETSSIQKPIACVDNNSYTQILLARSSLSNNATSKNDLTSSFNTNPELMGHQDITEEKSTQKKEEQTGNTFNKHKHILSVTQSDQTLTGAREIQYSNMQFSKKICSSLEAVAESYETPTAIESLEFDMKYSRDMKAQLNSSLNPTSHGSLTSTEDVDLITKRSQPCQTQDIMFKSSPIRHSSSKSIYSNVISSPGSIKSLDTNRGKETKTYYYSTESDADSDSCVEHHDVRSITPDIDWSYLNLVGNGNVQVSIAMIADTNNRAITAGVIGKPYNIYSRQKHSHAEEISEVIDTSILLEAKEQFISTPSERVHGYRIMGSQVPIHIFCNEVSSFQVVGYCGYYEAILDAVLENIAGFESFEEACDAIENIETLNEAYASCDTDFEEDDWDIGMKSGHQDEHPLSSSLINHHGCSHFESLEFLDRNQNVLAANSRNPKINFQSDYRDRYNTSVLPVTSETAEKGLGELRNKEASSATPNKDNQDSFKFATTGNLTADNGNGATKMGSSNLNQNLIFRPESIHSTEIHLRNVQVMKATTGDKEADRSSNDASSCATDGSPMSFSSSEMTYTSQETDHNESASEEDYSNSSQEDSVSLFSEIGYDPKMFIHKAKMKRLRREFFLSLYRKFDGKDMDTEDSFSVSSLDDAVSLGQSLTRLDNNNRDNVSEPDSHLDNVTGYNKSINTWKAFALVDLQTDDMSDSASDIFN